MPRQGSFGTKKRWTEIEARAAIEARAKSGLGLSEFAAREGLDPQRLRRWAQRLADDGVASPRPGAVFVELGGRQATLVEVALRSGRVVRVSDAIDPAVLHRLLDAIDGAAC